MTPDNSPPFPGFITIRQAMDRHGFTRGTAHNRADLGISIRVGRRRWIHADGLDALQVNDTGRLADAQSVVQDMANTD